MWWTITMLIIAKLVTCDHVPSVTTELGEIEGVILQSHGEKKVAAFLGIPYAKAPIGDLRFKAPVPIGHLDGQLKAHKLPPACIQSVIEKDENNLDQFVPTIPTSETQSEDCLYLNIYAQYPKSNNASVLVFLHAGGFLSDSSSSEKYDGRELVAEEDIIVVTLNFRLGAFGFLHLGNDEAPGNMGLQDIRAALQFVQKYISDFGGNPKKVTLMGEGTGAIAAGGLMLSHTCTCLFQQIVLLNGSPTIYMAVQSKEQAENIANTFADTLGCGHGAEGLECLRGKSAEELSKATSTMVSRKFKRFLLVNDGHFFTENPRVLAQQGRFDPTIRVLIGISHNRASVLNFVLSPLRPVEDSHITVGDFKNLIHTLLNDNSEYSTNAVLVFYTNITDPDDPDSIRENSLNFVNDITVACPLLNFADELLYSGNKVFVFYLDHHVDDSYPKFAGNMNGEEINYFFGHTNQEGKHYKDLEQDHGFTLMDMLARFVKEEDKADHDNDETEEDGKHLPKYSLRKKAYLNLKVGQKVGHFLRAEQCSYFKNSYRKVRLQGEFMAKNKC